MKRIISYFVFSLATLTSVLAQGENNHWIFGSGIGIDFNPPPVMGPGGTPEETVVNVPSFTVTPSEFTAYSDKNGSLLFYSNGLNVWNRDHEVLLNGDNLVAQAGGLVVLEAVALPQECDKYYLFYQGQLSGSSGTLFYSIVDMTLDNGMGGIPMGQKDRVLYQAPFRTVKVVTGISSNWLVGVAGFDDANIALYAFEVGPKEIKDPVISIIPIDDLRGLQYRTQFSPDGTTMFFIQDGLLFDGLPMYVLSFDRVTGEFEYSSKVIPDPPFSPEYNSNIISSTFSPDNQLVYTVERYGYCEQLVCYTAFSVFQYRFNKDENSLYESSKIKLASYTIEDDPIGQIKTTPNGKLFLSRFGTSWIDAIRRPNVKGSNCLYTSQYLNCPGETTSIKFSNQVLPANELQFIEDYDLVNAFSLCEGQTVEFSVEDCYDQITWFNGSMDTSIVIDEPGEYWVKINQGSCEYIQDFSVIDYIESNSVLPPDSVLCNNEILQVDLSQIQGITDIVWSDGSNASIRDFQESGNYFLEYMQDGCMFRDSLRVLQFDVPQNPLPDDTLKCFQDELQFEIDVEDAQYKWSGGSSASTLNIQEEGDYNVTITVDRCLVVDSISVANRENIDLNMPEQLTTCKGEGNKIEAFHPNLISYQWSDGSTSSSNELDEEELLILVANDQYCTFTDSTYVYFKFCKEVELYLPNVFSPNRDGVNDFYKIGIPDNVEFISGSMKIYDRYGSLVATIEDLETGWNGKLNGKYLMTGVYVALIEIEVEDVEGIKEVVTSSNFLLQR